MDLELCIGNTVHSRRPRNHPDVEMWLNQMSVGKADSYIIRAAQDKQSTLCANCESQLGEHLICSDCLASLCGFENGST